MIKNSVEIFHVMQKLQNQVQQYDVITSFSFIVFNSSIYIKLNSQSFMIIVQIITQILNNQSFLIIHLSVNFVTIIITSRFKKLLNIFKYKRNKDQLNAWKQSLIQCMNMNNDHYFFHWVKIIYVESWFIINKKIYNLMN